MSKARFRGAIPIGLLAAFVAGRIGRRLVADLRSAEAGMRREGRIAILGPRRRRPPAPRHVGRPPPARRSRRRPPPAHVATTGDVPRTRLRVPIDGDDIESFKGGFAERRGGDRPHEAVDILAPRNTPVHAVEDGTIAKLFTSKAGGLTIYQFDPSGRLCYYYAHLERYADGLKDGQAVSQGDVIGYVGTTGNAPPNTPHLHFAVFELNADKHWWQGRPVGSVRGVQEQG